jgi:hypothetical protein
MSLRFALLRWYQDLSSVLACAYKRNRKHLDLHVENGEVRFSALTMRLPWSGVLSAAPYHFDLIGGKGGTRTLDPGIMSAGCRGQVSDFSTSGQTAVAAKCLKVPRRAGEIPANLPRARMYCGELRQAGRSSMVRRSRWVGCNRRSLPGPRAGGRPDRVTLPKLPFPIALTFRFVSGPSSPRARL